MSKPQQLSVPQLAEFALASIATATITMDDQSLAVASATRQFLRMIVSGALVVSQPAPPTALPPPVNGSEGIVPAGATTGTAP